MKRGSPPPGATVTVPSKRVDHPLEMSLTNITF